MKFWAIEARPGELLVDEAIVDEAVSRIVGINTVEALCLFTSRVALDGFMEGFLPDDEVPRSRQELEAAFMDELRSAEADTDAALLRFPDFTPETLIEVMKTVSSDVYYVVVNPDSSGQQVWSVERFGAYLNDLLDRA